MSPVEVRLGYKKNSAHTLIWAVRLHGRPRSVLKKKLTFPQMLLRRRRRQNRQRRAGQVRQWTTMYGHPLAKLINPTSGRPKMADHGRIWPHGLMGSSARSSHAGQVRLLQAGPSRPHSFEALNATAAAAAAMLPNPTDPDAA